MIVLAAVVDFLFLSIKIDFGAHPASCAVGIGACFHWGKTVGILWKVTGQEGINLEIRKRKLRWIGHTLRKEDGEIPKAALLWNPQGSRKT